MFVRIRKKTANNPLQMDSISSIFYSIEATVAWPGVRGKPYTGMQYDGFSFRQTVG